MIQIYEFLILRARPKAMDEFADDAQLLVLSNGTIIWVPPIRFLTNCKMNLIRWPFDVQECYLKLGSWTYHEKEIDLQFGPGDDQSRVKLLNYEGQQFPNNTEWVIVDYHAVRTSKQYSCCLENYVDITYHFKIARKYSTYLYTIIYPILSKSVNPINSTQRVQDKSTKPGACSARVLERKFVLEEFMVIKAIAMDNDIIITLH